MANPLEGFKKLPTWGKAAVAIGGVGVAYFMYRNHQANAASSSSSASTGTGTDPLTGMPYSQDNQVDPQTGETYLAEAQQYGSVSAAEAAVAGGSGFGAYSSPYDSTGGYPVSGYYDSGSTLGTTSGYGTNAQWSQAAEAGLTDLGYSATDVSGALGRYLSNLPVTSTQATIIYAAIAEYGTPPVGSFTVVLQPTTGSGGGSGSTAKVKVPNVVGDTVNAAQTKVKAAGLSVNADTAKDKKGFDRKVTASDPKAGTSVAKGTHVGLTWHYVKSK